MPSAKSSPLPARGLVSGTSELCSATAALREASNARRPHTPAPRRPHTPAPPRSRRRLCSEMRLQVDRLAIVQSGDVRFAVCVPCKLVLSVDVPRIIEHVYGACSQPFPRTVPQAQVTQALVASNLSSPTAIAASPYRTPSGDPVPALPLYPSTRGFRCTRAACVYFAHDEATMRRHVKNHGTKPALGTTFARCKVQQIAKGKYISVSLAHGGDGPLATPLRMTRLVSTSDAPLTPSTTTTGRTPTEGPSTKHIAPAINDTTKAVVPPTKVVTQPMAPTMATSVAGREPVTAPEEAAARETTTQRQVSWPYRFSKRATQNFIDLSRSPPVVVDLTLSDDESESDFDLPLSPRSYADLCQRARNATDTYNV
ncbi:hypothetical protein SDRG_16253 [Saprolegnia diclina VS20]|uniref:Uncharacterized protein n=1 Tax=Saprolegnia diclina (strain VS20) TaxID=1156394 RepID=T0PXW2_SAPDV|nr:hypothetical protein SDRG_16253 [Saprolegnia diclina VS20]EQC25880.1 hypothetical protein SDRG_16253 [Saprolegnia diclina VS20]|eukprot:XP_008620676.1 hypothetical protein SDRG_16253 [Saprolegnia diclina VS20]